MASWCQSSLDRRLDGHGAFITPQASGTQPCIESFVCDGGRTGLQVHGSPLEILDERGFKMQQDLPACSGSMRDPVLLEEGEFDVKREV
jgi:hypothetical protein